MSETPSQDAAESRTQRFGRRSRNTIPWVWVAAIVAALVILIALIVANTKKVTVSWVFGDGSVSLIWVIVVSGLAGWVLGIATVVLLRQRRRRRA